MDLNLFVRGWLIGLSVAAAVGPISVLCIQRTLRSGFAYGMVSGLGVATADALYGCVAGFGLTIIALFLVHQQIWFHALGGLFLLYLGIKTLLTRPAERAATVRATNFVGAYVSIFLLTLANPLTILSFVAIFAGIGVGSGRSSPLSALLVVCGVFLGSTSWWCLLTGGISLFRRSFTAQWLLWIHRMSGCLIALFGLLALVSLIGT